MEYHKILLKHTKSKFRIKEVLTWSWHWGNGNEMYLFGLLLFLALPFFFSLFVLQFPFQRTAQTKNHFHWGTVIMNWIWHWEKRDWRTDFLLMVSPVPADGASEGVSIGGERVRERVWMRVWEELGFLRDCVYLRCKPATTFWL